jgi:hypothetical protein
MLVGLLVASVGVVGLGVVGLAEGAAKKPSLKVNVPKQVKVGKSFKVKASGYSGKFNAVTIYARSAAAGACGATKAEEGAHRTGYRADLATNQSFKKSKAFVASSPQPALACVYLWEFAKPAATDQIRVSKSFTIVP